MAPVKKKTNGYWQGEVDTLLKGLTCDTQEIKDTIKYHAEENAKQHKEIQSNIGSLREKAAKWGGIAGLMVSIGSFLALLFLSHLIK